VAKKYPDEQVLVVPTSVFEEIGYFQGFSVDTEKYVERLLGSDQLCFLPRDEVEVDPSYKQLIPYVIFRQKSSFGDFLFAYTRGKGMGEARLHAKKSVGVGGHISSTDVAADSTSIYQEGMNRELQEEVTIDSEIVSKQVVGILNDDTNDVGKVHLGIVHLFDVTEPSVTPNEEDILEAGFYPTAEILEKIDGFETWSQIAIKALFGK